MSVGTLVKGWRSMNFQKVTVGRRMRSSFERDDFYERIHSCVKQMMENPALARESLRGVIAGSSVYGLFALCRRVSRKEIEDEKKEGKSTKEEKDKSKYWSSGVVENVNKTCTRVAGGLTLTLLSALEVTLPDGFTRPSFPGIRGVLFFLLYVFVCAVALRLATCIFDRVPKKRRVIRAVFWTFCVVSAGEVLACLVSMVGPTGVIVVACSSGMIAGGALVGRFAANDDFLSRVKWAQIFGATAVIATGLPYLPPVARSVRVYAGIGLTLLAVFRAVKKEMLAVVKESKERSVDSKQPLDPLGRSLLFMVKSLFAFF